MITLIITYSWFSSVSALNWLYWNKSTYSILVLDKIILFIRPSSDGTYYGMVMSVRPGLRQPVFHIFLQHALTHWAEILHMTLFKCTTDQVWVSSICINLCGSYTPFGTSTTENTQFSAFFSNMLWHIELKFCIWLCCTVLQIKFECRQFASIFMGVMPLLELRILEIHSFPHFSLTCFDILSWNFAFDFVLLYCRSSSSVINLRQFLWELCPFWNLEYWKYTVFRTFLLHALTYLAEILHLIFFTVLQIKFECRQFASIFVGVMPLLELRILEIHSFLHFSLTCFDIHVLSWNFAYDFVLLYNRLSSSVVNLRQFLWELCPFWNFQYWKYTFFCTFLLHAFTYWAEFFHMTLFNVL